MDFPLVEHEPIPIDSLRCVDVIFQSSRIHAPAVSSRGPAGPCPGRFLSVFLTRFALRSSHSFSPLPPLPEISAPYDFPVLLSNLTKLAGMSTYPYHVSLLPLLHLPPPTLRLFVSHFQTLKITKPMADWINGLNRNTYRAYKLLCYSKIVNMVKSKSPAPPPLSIILSYAYLLSSLSHVFPPSLTELLPNDSKNKLAVLVATHLTYSHCNEHCYVGDTLEADLERR